jgi:hypothetical protein
MNWIEFTSSVITALAWPLGIVIIVLLLRNKLTQILPHLEQVTAGPGGIDVRLREQLHRTQQALAEEAEELDSSAGEGGSEGLPGKKPETPAESRAKPRGETPSDKQLRGKSKEYFYAIARESPEAAIIEAWLLVELEVLAAARRSGINISDNPPPEVIVKRVEGWDLPTPRRVNTYIGNLHKIRNQVVHTTEPVTEATAIDYIDTVMQLTHYLRQAM